MIKEIVYEYWKEELPDIKAREIRVDMKTDFVVDIVGVRRSGKTFLMLDAIKKLTKEVDKKATIYINFENRRLVPLKIDYFNELIEFVYAENLIEKYKKIYFFLDEIQKIVGWEKYIRSIYDEFKGKIKIFVSGSSANLLSKDYGRLLTGRHLTTKVFPLSFKEFLVFKNFSTEKVITERETALIKKYLDEFLTFGSFPEVVLENEKEKILNQLFNDILTKDVLGRVEVRKESLIEEIAYFLMSNISSLISFNKIARYFKSRGIKISVPTIQNYFYLMKNAFLLFDNLIFSYKVKEQLQYPRKIYCIDSGLANFIGFKFSKDLGRLYENTVAVEIMRRSLPITKIFYWKNPQQEEVDFVVKEGMKIKQLVQVCYDIEKEETKKREVRALIKASKELRCKNLFVITKDYEAEENYDSKKIKFMPLWKWLLK